MTNRPLCSSCSSRSAPSLPPVSASARPPQIRSAMLVTQQQLARPAGQARQHLAGEVVGHRAVVAREPRHERVRIGLAPHRQPGEPQAGGPALRALEQALDEAGRQLEAELVEQRRGLVQREGEVGRAQLAEAAGEPQALERQLRIRAAGRDDVHGVAAVHEQLAERCERGAAEEVEVIEHQRAGAPDDVASASASRSGTSSSRGSMSSSGTSARCSASQTSVHRRRASQWRALEREPGRVVLRGPPAQEHGLAPAGGRADERERAVSARVELPREAGTLDGGAGKRGDCRPDSDGAAHHSTSPPADLPGNGARRCVPHRPAPGGPWCAHLELASVLSPGGSRRTSISSSPSDWMRSSSPCSPAWSLTGPCEYRLRWSQVGVHPLERGQCGVADPPADPDLVAWNRSLHPRIVAGLRVTPGHPGGVIAGTLPRWRSHRVRRMLGRSSFLATKPIAPYSLAVSRSMGSSSAEISSTTRRRVRRGQ